MDDLRYIPVQVACMMDGPIECLADDGSAQPRAFQAVLVLVRRNRRGPTRSVLAVTPRLLGVGRVNVDTARITGACRASVVPAVKAGRQRVENQRMPSTQYL
jgi:hypothetical protein